MSPRAAVVDSESFTRDGAVLGDTVPVAGLARLAEAVFDRRGELEYEVRGSVDRDGKRWIDLSVRACLHLQCQRCLEGLDWSAEFSRRLLLVAEGRPVPEDELSEDRWDVIEAGPRLNLVEIVEDEVLLALPYAPRHEECQAPSGADGGGEKSPFAVLASMPRSGAT